MPINKLGNWSVARHR